MRSVKKTIKNLKVNERYDLTIEDVEEIKNIAEEKSAEPYEQMWHILITAFKFGYACGSKAERKAINEQSK